MKIKTIDVTAKEWFDKINGNSYFSARVVTDFGTRAEKTYYIPFEYGYGDYYLQAGAKVLTEHEVIAPCDILSSSTLKAQGIIFRYGKQEGVKKTDVTAWGRP